MTSDPLEAEPSITSIYKDLERENKKLLKLLEDGKKAGPSMKSDELNKRSKALEAQRKRVKAILDQIDELEKKS
jgi:hypothetical protein